MDGIKAFCETSGNGILHGLAQELNIQPGQHYKPIARNSSRVFVIKLAGINPHFLPEIKKLGDKLTMFAGLDERHKVRIGWHGSNILFEIPKPGSCWERVTIESLEQRRCFRRGPVVTLGLGLQDEPIRIDFNAPATGHVLGAGATRSGKTNAMQEIIWNLARYTSPNDAKFLIFDVAKKGFKWAGFGHVPNLIHPIVTDIIESERVLAWVNQEIVNRGAKRYTTPKVFVVIDELKALVDDSDLVSDSIARIASVGGEFGIHLIMATQYPQIKMLGDATIKRNATIRLCGKVDDSHAASNALGIADSGAETLQGYGDFLLRDYNGLARFTVAHIQPKHIERLEKVVDVPRLELPESDTVYNGPKPTKQAEPLDPEHVAVALFNPMSINALQKELGIGGAKATRVKNFADNVRQWAIDNGQGKQYCFITNRFIECK